MWDVTLAINQTNPIVWLINFKYYLGLKINHYNKSLTFISNWPGSVISSYSSIDMDARDNWRINSLNPFW